MKTANTTRILWLICGVGGIGFLVAAGASSCNTTPAHLAVVPPYVDASVPAAPEATTPEFVGVLTTGYSVDVTPKLEGKVEAVFVHAGDRVQAGASLALVDLHKTEQDIAIAKADLAAAYADLRDAEQKWRRRIPLGGSAISREELESAHAQAQTARARVASKQASLQQLNLAMRDAQLRAPFTGVIAARYVDPGAVAGPGRPVLRLIGEGDPQVRFAVPAEFAHELPPGRTLRVVVSSPAAVLAGVVARVAPEIDTGSHMVFAVGKVQIPAEMASRLSSGIVARVSVANVERETRDELRRPVLDENAPGADPLNL